MSLAKPIIPGRVYLLTRRCTQRTFLLRPDSTTNQLFLYCFAVAANRFGIGVISVVAMSNHYHATVHDPEGNLSRFLEYFHRLVAHAMNCRWHRSENLWSSEDASYTWLVELEDVLAKTVYTLGNPVLGDLVEKAEHWPGVTSFHWLDVDRVEVERPAVFFGANSKLPERVQLEFVAPPGFDGTLADWNARVRAELAELESSASGRRARAGHGVVGKKRIRAASHLSRPTTPAPRSRLRPLIAAGCPEAMARARRELQSFRARYALALAAFREGKRDAPFPHGTNFMVRRCGVSVDDPAP